MPGYESHEEQVRGRRRRIEAAGGAEKFRELYEAVERLVEG
jgi:hypothetical protein